MPLYRRTLRRSVFCLLGMISGVCAAQNQFTNQPREALTYGRVTSFLTGTLQSQPGGPDILYINAPTITAGIPSILVGELLQNPGLNNLPANRITFTNVSNVAAALGDFNADNITDYAFVLSPTPTSNNGTGTLCVYYGTGATVNDIQSQSPPSSYNNNAVNLNNHVGSVYPPLGGTSGCISFPAQGSQPPNFAYMAALPFKTTNGVPQLLVEDSANNYLYIFTNAGETAVNGNGVLRGFAPLSTLPLANGAGPITTGDFNNDGCTDFIINSQNSHTATVYLGNSSCNGTFQAPVTYAFDKGVYSMLLQNMNGAKYPNGNLIQDMVVEGNDGSIEIFPGDGNGGFTQTSIGGTATGLNSLSGNGGHLAAIGDLTGTGTLDILTTTPIGLSVLTPQNGIQNYTLKNIYNIGPGRSAFALGSFYNNFALAVDSAEGIIFALADGNGGFQTSLAYPALAPALGATVGQFRSHAYYTEVYVSPPTGAQQGYAVDQAGNNYLFDTTAIYEMNPSWSTVYTNSSPFTGLTAGITHLGDGEYYGGKLYVPAETWIGCPSTNQTIAVYSANVSGLPLLSSRNISADNHEVSSIAVGPSGTSLYVSSFCDGSKLWIYDSTSLTLTGTLTLSTTIPLIQGISYNSSANQFVISSDNPNETVGYLYYVSMSGTVTGPFYTVPVTGELEGVDYTQGNIRYLINQQVHFLNTDNQSGCLDVAVTTGAVQGQLLTGNTNSTGSCNGTFNTFPSVVDTSPPNFQPLSLPLGVWSNILSGDFDGDGNLDVLYSLTGLPLPTSGTGLYVQYGNGDGTFQAPVPVSGASPGNTLYGESTVGTFNSGANAGIANIDANFDDTLLGQSSNTFNVGMNHPETNTAFNQVAAGYFKTGSSYQDLVFQQGTSLVPYVNQQDRTGKNFTPMLPALTGPSPAADYAITTVLLTDIDGDGNGDILALYHNLASDPSNPSPSTPNWMYIWWGSGDGTFSLTPLAIQLSRNYYLAAVGDMNAEGMNDIVLSDGYLLSILFNQSGGTSPNRNFASDWITCYEAYGNNCHEQHFLAGQGINSLSLQSVRGGTSPDVVVSNGGATISNAIVLGGAAQTSVILPANPPDVNTGGITVLLNGIITQPVTVTLNSSPNPSGLGEAFTITATLTPTLGVAIPTGYVVFYIDGTQVGAPGLLAPIPGSTTSSASASVTVPLGNTYPTGTYTLTASYAGDPNNSPASLKAAKPQTIQGAATTTVLALCIGGTLNCPVVGPPTGTLTVVSPLSMIYGQVYNGLESVNDTDGSTFAGTGTLDFYQDTTVLLCSLRALSTTPCPPNVGTGTPAGTHEYDSVYSGDTNYLGSTSNTVTIIVGRDTPAMTVSGSPSPSPQGQAVTLTAKLLGANAPQGTPASPVESYLPATGTVVFMNGSTTLCSSTLVADSSNIFSAATCTTSTLPAGTDQITASYAGDTNFLPANSAPFAETITPLIPPSFAVTVTPNPLSVGVGYAAILTVSVTPLNGFAQDVDLACGNLPSEATCTFSSPTIPGGSGSSTLIVGTTAPHDCGTTQPYFLGGNGGGRGLTPLALPALAGLLAIILPGKRRWLRALVAVLLAAGATQIVGCSTCTDLGTRPATYTFQVTGTAADGSASGSQAVTFNVTI